MGLTSRLNGQLPPEVPLSEVDLGRWSFWDRDDDAREAAFLALRRHAPVSFQREPRHPDFEPGKGHWALTTFDDVFYASRHPDLFSSASGINIGDQDPSLAEYFGSMIAMDDPRHQRLRSIVSRAFTPRVLKQIEESVVLRARSLVAAMARRSDGTGELVADLAGPLPLQVICDMMGIPEDDHERIFHWTNIILGFGDPDMTSDFNEFVTVAMEIGAYATALAEDRRSNPGDDLTSSLVQAEVDGESLTSAEIASFFILLVVAGNETTRNAISHGLLALTRHPDERAVWWSDFDAVAPTAVEEIVRWGSPVQYMRRTLTRDVTIRDTPLRAGDKVTLWYGSANRDESKFADPFRFDVRRTPNQHLGYGGGGVHFCLGANLARREITVAFAELHRQLPDIEATEEPARLWSPFIHGIKSLPVAWSIR